ncbi:MAG: type I-E CRISPR-associated protein Cse2/CasB [Nitrospiraceae bacterium]|nr:MAG: type I-E CRISPR-associated protein Cse2/CasB [Nitrospiraceae bacterium]
MEQRLPDFMSLYKAWDQLQPGPKAELKRAAVPEDMIETPAFYRLFSGKAGTEWEKQAFQRMIYCLPCITHTEGNVKLGAALARGGKSGKSVSEKRLFQVIRSSQPNDMIQLRRILKMVEPVANWPMAAKQLWYWNDRSKRDLLEDFFLNKTND